MLNIPYVHMLNMRNTWGKSPEIEGGVRRLFPGGWTGELRHATYAIILFMLKRRSAGTRTHA